MSFDRELQAMAAERPGISEKARRWAMRQIVKRKTYRAYAQVFLNEQGELSEAGRIVLGDMARMAEFGRSAEKLPDADLRVLQGRRALVLRVIDSLHMDEIKLARMARQYREMQDE